MKLSELRHQDTPVVSPGAVDPVQHFIDHNVSDRSYGLLTTRDGNVISFAKDHGGPVIVELQDIKKIPLVVKLDCSNCKLIRFNSSCKLDDLHNIEKLILKFGFNKGVISFDVPIKRNILGLMLIENLDDVLFTYVHVANSKYQQQEVSKILRKHLNKGHDGLIDCQHELIENGFDEFASL